MVQLIQKGKSTVPPTAHGTTIRIGGFWACACAQAGAVNDAAMIAVVNAIESFLNMSVSSVYGSKIRKKEVFT